VPPSCFCTVDREADVAAAEGEIATPFAQEQQHWAMVQLNMWQEELFSTLRKDQRSSFDALERWREEVLDLLRTNLHSIQESIGSMSVSSGVEADSYTNGAKVLRWSDKGALMQTWSQGHGSNGQQRLPRLDSAGSLDHSHEGKGASGHEHSSSSKSPRSPADAQISGSVGEPFLAAALPLSRGPMSPLQGTSSEDAIGSQSQRKKFEVKLPIHKGTNANVEALKKAKGWSEECIVHDQGVTRSLRSSVKAMWSCSFLERHLWLFSTFLVMSNTIFIGVQVDRGIRHASNQEDEPEWMTWVSRAFAVAFTWELGLRLAAFKTRFFCGPDRWWNYFEICLILTTWAEILLDMLDLSFIRALRIFRAIRAVRVVRVVRWVRELRMMVASILCSLVSLAWAFVFLFFVLYLFAIYILMDVQSHMYHLTSPDALDSWSQCGSQTVPGVDGTMTTTYGPDCQLIFYYGTLWDAMLSLFKAISGGQDWFELLEPLDRVSPIFYNSFFVFYVGFVVFGVMNILTAIFVESASSIAEIDKDLVIQEQISRQNSAVNALRRVFYEADADKTQTITRQELEEHLQDEQVMAYLKFLELDIQETRGLFQLLDVDEKDEVGIEEIVMGMMRLKGAAKGVDIATLMYENKRIFVRLAAFMHYVEDNFMVLNQMLSIEQGSPRTSMEEYVWSAKVEDKMMRNFSNRADMGGGRVSDHVAPVRSQQLGGAHAPALAGRASTPTQRRDW